MDAWMITPPSPPSHACVDAWVRLLVDELRAGEVSVGLLDAARALQRRKGNTPLQGLLLQHRQEISGRSAQVRSEVRVMGYA